MNALHSGSSVFFAVCLLALHACTTGTDESLACWVDGDNHVAALGQTGRDTPGHGPSADPLVELDDLMPPASPLTKRRGITDFAAHFRPMVWFPELSGDVSLDDGAGLSTSLSFSALDVDSLEASFAGEVNLRWSIFDIWVSGFSFDVSDNTLLTGSVTFGNITFGASSVVDTDIEIDNIQAAFGVALVSTDAGLRFGPKVGVSLYRVSVDLESSVGGVLVSESLEEHLPIPFIGAHAEISVPQITFIADASLFFIDVDEVQAPFVDISGMVIWRPADNLGIFAGYRYLSYDVDFRDAGRSADISIELHGPFVGAELRF